MATMEQARPVDPQKLDGLLTQAVNDMGAAMHSVLIVIGDQLGLYRAMANGNPVTPAELATRTGTAERYIREWLNASAASHYVEYDASSGTYSMTPEQAFALALGRHAGSLTGLLPGGRLLYEGRGQAHPHIPNRERTWLA